MGWGFWGSRKSRNNGVGVAGVRGHGTRGTMGSYTAENLHLICSLSVRDVISRQFS